MIFQTLPLTSMFTQDQQEGYHRIYSEEELEHFIRGGWENFILRPFGERMFIHITEELFDEGLAQLSLYDFKGFKPPNWTIFRELLTAAKRHQVCVPGPLTAHDKAQLTVGILKCANKVPVIKYTNHFYIDDAV